MHEVPKPETEPQPEDPKENTGFMWKSKWGDVDAPAAPGVRRAAITKVVAIVVVGVIVVAVAVFFFIGGPKRFTSQNIQQPPAISTTVTVPSQGQPANDSGNLVPQINPGAGS